MIQPRKILVFGKKPEISLKIRLFGVGKKFIIMMQGFPNSGKELRRGKFPPVRWGRIGSFTGGDFFTG